MAYGAVSVFCIVGPTTDEPCFGYVKEVVDNYHVLNKDAYVFFIGIPCALLNGGSDLGADAHPSYKGQQKIANTIVPVISTVMEW